MVGQKKIQDPELDQELPEYEKLRRCSAFDTPASVEDVPKKADN